MRPSKALHVQAPTSGPLLQGVRPICHTWHDAFWAQKWISVLPFPIFAFPLKAVGLLSLWSVWGFLGETRGGKKAKSQLFCFPFDRGEVARGAKTIFLIPSAVHTSGRILCDLRRAAVPRPGTGACAALCWLHVSAEPCAPSHRAPCRRTRFQLGGAGLILLFSQPSPAPRLGARQGSFPRFRAHGREPVSCARRCGAGRSSPSPGRRHRGAARQMQKGELEYLIPVK